MTLNQLARKYNTDKWQHGCLDWYEDAFRRLDKPIEKLLELGSATGASMRMWLEYLPQAHIWGIDMDAHSIKFCKDCPPDRLTILHCNFRDLAMREAMLRAIPWPMDVIIDDDGHHPEDQQSALAVLFPMVRPGGLYVIEDMFFSSQYNPKREAWTTMRMIEAMAARAPWDSLHITPEQREILMRDIAKIEVHTNLHKDAKFAYIFKKTYLEETK